MDENNTYWNNNGTHTKLYDQLSELIPSYGEVTMPRSSKLERLRKMANAYHDIYNNGGGNRNQAISRYFSIRSYDLNQNHINWDLCFEKTEPAMDKAILEAAKEQNLI